MSSPSQTKTITITVNRHPDLSGSFKIPFSDTPTFTSGKNSFPMKDSPIVTLSNDGKQTVSGGMRIDVPGYGSVTYLGDFELEGAGSKGTVHWSESSEGDDSWTSSVTTPIPAEEKKSYG